MVRKKEIRNTPKDPHPFMLLLTCLTSVFPPKDIQLTLGRGNIGILSLSVKSLTHWLTKVFSGPDSLQNLPLRKKSVREYLCRSRYTSFFSSQPRDALRGPHLWRTAVLLRLMALSPGAVQTIQVICDEVESWLASNSDAPHYAAHTWARPRYWEFL